MKKNALYMLSRRTRMGARGATLIEYLLIVGVVAIFGLGAYSQFGGDLRAKVNQQRGSFNSGVAGTPR